MQLKINGNCTVNMFVGVWVKWGEVLKMRFLKKTINDIFEKNRDFRKQLKMRFLKKLKMRFFSIKYFCTRPFFASMSESNH